MKTKMIIKNQKGASAVEFAIIAPLLFVLLFGVLEGGLALYNKAVITNACREGARDGIVLRSPALDQGELDALVLNTVTNYTTSRLISFDGNVTPDNNGIALIPPVVMTDVNGGGIGAGDSLTVTVNYTYSFLALPNLLQLIKGSYSKTIQLSAVTIMRFE
jgi:Flp pilus assembly protein TadG